MKKRNEGTTEPVWVGLCDNAAAKRAAIRCFNSDMSPEEGEGDLWDSEEPGLVLWMIAKEMEAYEQAIGGRVRRVYL